MTARTICTVALTLVASAALAAAISEGLAHATPVSNWVPISPPDASSHASGVVPTAPPVAPAPAAQLHNPVTDPGPAMDDVQAARRLGWPVAVMAIVTMLALVAGTAGARVPWLAWLARGAAATLLGAVAACGSAAYDAAIAGGAPAAIGTAAIAAILAFWRAHRRPAPQPAEEEPAGVGEVEALRHRLAGALDISSGGPGSSFEEMLARVAASNRHATRTAQEVYERGRAAGAQRGSVPVSLLAWLCSAVLLVGGGMLAWSCSGTQRRGVAAAVVDCTIGTLAEHAEALRPLAVDAIKSGHWDALASAAKAVGLEDAGCSAAAALAELLAPPAGVAERSLTASPGPSPATLRAGWERLRDGALGGRHFVTAGEVM